MPWLLSGLVVVRVSASCVRPLDWGMWLWRGGDWVQDPSECAFLLSCRWKPLHMVGWQSQRSTTTGEALGLEFRNVPAASAQLLDPKYYCNCDGGL